MINFSIEPEKFYLFGVNIGLSVVVAWGVMALLIALLVIFRLTMKKTFKEVPGGFQNVIEMLVDGIRSFSRSSVGQSADFIAPVALTLMVYIFFTTAVELFGLPPATKDINCGIALGLSSLVMVNVTGIRKLGLWGRVKRLAHPSAVVAPIRVMTDLIAPFSMALRLFSNVLVGEIIMLLIYSFAPVLVPAPVSAYFSLAHILIQSLVFGMLMLTYTGEVVEDLE